MIIFNKEKFLQHNMGTAYLVIPKEKAERLITTKVSNYETTSRDSDKIEIEKNGSWRITLTDYKFKNERVELPGGNAESGVLGCEMEYHRKVKNSSIWPDPIFDYMDVEP